jgi:hypothetical protein
MQKPFRVQPPATASYKVNACPAAPATARPLDDGLLAGEIAAFDGFWQGRTLAEMRTRAGAIARRAPAISDFVGVKTYLSYGMRDDPRGDCARPLLANIVARF